MIYQAVFFAFGAVSFLITVIAMIVIFRSKVLIFKPLWFIGSLVGFVGLGIDWTSPDDLFLQIGVQIPFISFRMFFETGGVLAKVLFPVIAVIAIIKDRKDWHVDVDQFR